MLCSIFKTTVLPALAAASICSSVLAVAESPLEVGSPSLTKDTPNLEEVKTKPPKRVRSAKRRGCSSYAEPRYRRMVRNWQVVPKIPTPKYRFGYRDIVLYSVNHGERIRIFPFREDGSLDPEAEAAVQHLLRDKETDTEYPIHPRLIKLLYRIADAFNAKQINVVSGYRASTEDNKEGNHTRGMAVDFMIPGVSLGAVAKKVRTFGHAGVGFYPVSGFVHMDVRDGPSYFWIDRSGPGKPTCLRRIHAETGARADRKWNPEDDDPVITRNKQGEIRSDETAEVDSAASTVPGHKAAASGVKKS